MLSQFKSVFGAPATADAKAPAATPFKSVVGVGPVSAANGDSSVRDKRVWVCTRCGKVKDLRGEHLVGKSEIRSDCWPCAKKSTFRLECPAERQYNVGKDVSDNTKGAAQTLTVKAEKESASHFRDPIIPPLDKEDEVLIQKLQEQSNGHSNPAAASSVWRCRECGKVKALSGEHLAGKSEVRSDCWPCGAKRTFILKLVDEYQSTSPGYGGKTDGTRSHGDKKETTQQKDSGNAQSSTASSKKEPAATPFKSVFGAPATADAKAPTATPFKSVFGAPATADAKAPTATPFKSVFGAPATADAKAPTATPFKSVFGAPATADAKAPTATPFKSVFGAPATADAKAPTATPFKSVFGAPAAADAKAPAATPFKSVFGAPATADAKAPAATPFKSVVGVGPVSAANGDSSVRDKRVWVCTRCGKVKDLRGEHLVGKSEIRSDCWPCAKKSTFRLECPAERQYNVGKDVSDNTKGAAQTLTVKAEKESASHFRDPIIPPLDKEDEVLIQKLQEQSNGHSNPAAASSVWRCRECGKVKALSGEHLAGKSEVRSDCWPCGAKRTFILKLVDEYQSTSPGYGGKTDGTRSHGDKKETTQQKDSGNAQSSTASSKKEPAATPFKSVFGAPATADAKAPAATPFKSVFGAPATADAKAPTATPFKSVFGAPATADAKAPTATPFKSVFGAPATADAKAPTATPFKSVFGAPATADAKAPTATPFKSVFGAPATADAKAPAATPFKSVVGVGPVSAANGDSSVRDKRVWVCTRCGKVKDLRGEHLVGKSEIRSDCWPCAKKSTFRLECPAERQYNVGKDVSDNTKGAAQTLTVKAEKESASHFRDPIIPPLDKEDEVLIQKLQEQSNGHSNPAAASSVWRCRECGKVKALSGEHLAGKSEVRSDCWPCGAKRTFILKLVDEYQSTSPGYGGKTDGTRSHGDKKETTQQKDSGNAQSSTASSKKEPAATPFKSVFGAPATADAKAPTATPFKSVFGAPATADAKAPTATPFKSVFGAPAAADAKAPTATPFKSVFGAPATADAKAPAATPFKSVFGAPATADAKAPAATPFKSVFGAPATADAKAPTATPFKSVFGAPAAADAKAPAATPFKSVFGAPATADAKAPAATPFKSVFGAPATADAKAPAATPFKSVFGAPATADAKAPTATPFKSVFGAPAAADAKAPAATPFKSVFGAPATADAKAPAATPFKSVFGAPATADAKAPAATPFKSVFGAPATADAKAPTATPFKSVFGAPAAADAKGPADCSNVFHNAVIAGGGGPFTFLKSDGVTVSSSACCVLKREDTCSDDALVCPDGFESSVGRDEDVGVSSAGDVGVAFDFSSVVCAFEEMIDASKKKILLEFKSNLSSMVSSLSRGVDEVCRSGRLSSKEFEAASGEDANFELMRYNKALRSHLENAFRKPK